MNALQILKNTGCIEDFSLDKLINSLVKSGVPKQKAHDIALKLRSKCSDRTTTKKLYTQARNLIKKEDKIHATNYSMAKAITELGPDGYHFERFICEIFKKMGYEAKTNYFAKGRCVQHEIDVLAINHKTIFCECKFHNNANTKNDLKTALYVNARFIDIKENKENTIDEFWLISNTQFTKDAIEYANCAGLYLLGPNAPEKHSLSNLAIKNKIFPIGSLTGIKKKHVKILNDNKCIITKQLIDDPKLIDILGLSSKEKENIIKEAKRLEGKR